MRRRRDADLAPLAVALHEVHVCDGYPARWPADPVAWLSPESLVSAWTVEAASGPVGHVALTCVRSGEATSDVWSAAARTDPSRLVCVTRLFVAPDARGHGAGAALLSRAGSTAAGSGRRAVLEVAESDRAAVRLYERCGWLDAGSLMKDPSAVRSRLFVAPPDDAVSLAR